MMKRTVAILLSVILIVTCFTACSSNNSNSATKPMTDSACAIEHELEFGGVYIKITIDDFDDLGFKYGDSVKVAFSNGYTLEDVPYYNGYYTQTGEPLLVAYPGYPYIKAGINNGDDLWEVAGLTEADTATVTVNEAGKYYDIQNARDIHYTDNREDYASDEVFANFRSISVSTMKENTVYRSASPCDNQHNRAPYVDALINEAGVNFIVNLADDEKKIEGYINAKDFASPYFITLFNSNKVIPLAMNMNFASDEFKQKVAKGLIAMTVSDGPYLVHCTEGKDRTGFVCMLLEALSGASYQEIVDDYMITYDNYYGITNDSIDISYLTLNSRRGRVGPEIAHTLTTNSTQAYYFVDMNPNPKLTEIARCITTRHNSGISKHKGEHSAVMVIVKELSQEEVLAVRDEQDNHWFFDNDENQKLTALIMSDGKGHIFVGYIRRLMPIECWRLQGFTDEQFNTVQSLGICDGDLYKMAGNAVSVPVISAFGEKIKEILEGDNDNA